MMKFIRCLGLALLATVCFSPFGFAAEPVLAYLKPGYMYAAAEAEFCSVLEHNATMVSAPSTGTPGGLVRDSQGFLQYSADQVGEADPGVTLRT